MTLFSTWVRYFVRDLARHRASSSTHGRRLGIALAASLVLGGCTLVVEDELSGLAVDQAAKRNVTVRLRDFSAHVGQLVTIELVQPNDQQLRARAVIDPLPSVCLDVRLFRGAPIAASRIDFWADLNMNRMLDDPGDDHAWRFPVPESGDFLYVHNTDFTFIASDQPSRPLGTDLVVNITGAEVHDGLPVVVSLVNQNLVDPGPPMVFRDSVSGLYRLGGVVDGTVGFTLPGIVDAGTEYTIEMTFGDGVERCITQARAPATGDFLVELDYAELSCEPAPSVDCVALDEACNRRTTGADCDRLHRECPIVDCQP